MKDMLGKLVIPRGVTLIKDNEDISELIKTEKFKGLFEEGNGLIRITFESGVCNCLKEDGTLLFDEGYDFISEFEYDGYAGVRREDGRMNFINRQQETMFKEWYYAVYEISENVYIVVREKEKYYDTDRHGNLIERERKKYYLVDKHGNIMYDHYFPHAVMLNEEIIRVMRDDCKLNFINKDGTFVSEEWFENATRFCEGLALVQRSDGLYNYLKPDGTFWCETWAKFFPGMNEYHYGIWWDYREEYKKAQKDKGK